MAQPKCQSSAVSEAHILAYAGQLTHQPRFFRAVPLVLRIRRHLDRVFQCVRLTRGAHAARAGRGAGQRRVGADASIVGAGLSVSAGYSPTVRSIASSVVSNRLESTVRGDGYG